MAEVAWVRGALCDRIVQATQRAISAGTLQSITTTKQIVMSDGVPFVLRLMERKGEKRFDTARAPRPEGFNPFLPYEVSCLCTCTVHSQLVRALALYKRCFVVNLPPSLCIAAAYLFTCNGRDEHIESQQALWLHSG